jgi:hypothetical protein
MPGRALYAFAEALFGLSRTYCGRPSNGLLSVIGSHRIREQEHGRMELSGRSYKPAHGFVLVLVFIW